MQRGRAIGRHATASGVLIGLVRAIRRRKAKCSVQHALDQQSARLISAHDSIEHVSVQHASVQHASVQHNPRSITRLGSAHPSRFIIARTVQHTPWFSTPRFSARLGSARLSSARLAPARLAPSRISTPRTTSLWLVGRTCPPQCGQRR